jgi:hypothetical protein
MLHLCTWVKYLEIGIGKLGIISVTGDIYGESYMLLVISKLCIYNPDLFISE